MPKFAAPGAASFITQKARASSRQSRRSQSARRPYPARRPLTGFEQLETRAVLSANVIPAPTFDLAIHGTDIQFSPLGLPAAMGGDLYLAGSGAGHASIGRYQETLTPILVDINGDQVPDFVGTQGVATFTFYVGNAQHLFGTITTADTSYIQGVTPAGQLLVGSQGTIISATSALKNVSGGFVSQSTVGLVPTFEMQTNVHFTVNRPFGPALTVLAIANDLVSANNADHSQPAVNPMLMPSDHSCDHNNGDSPSGDHAHHDEGSAHDVKLGADSAHGSRDRIFADDVDWLPGSTHHHAQLG